MSHEKTHEQLVNLFEDFNAVTTVMQLEMSKALVTSPVAAERLKRQLKMSDSKAFQVLNEATFQFIRAFPLATFHDVNLSCRVFDLHSQITKDDTMHRVFEEINQRVYDKRYAKEA